MINTIPIPPITAIHALAIKSATAIHTNVLVHGGNFFVAVGVHCCVFRRLDTRVTCEMVSDGGGRFISAYIVGVHTLSL